MNQRSSSVVYFHLSSIVHRFSDVLAIGRHGLDTAGRKNRRGLISSCSHLQVTSWSTRDLFTVLHILCCRPCPPEISPMILCSVRESFVRNIYVVSIVVNLARVYMFSCFWPIYWNHQGPVDYWAGKNSDVKKNCSFGENSISDSIFNG